MERGMWAKGWCKVRRRQAGTGEHCTGGEGLATCKGDITEEKLFTPHFMRDDPIPPQ